MASIRQQIMDKIESKLRSIQVSNGYQTDIGNNVFPWLLTTPPALPGLSFRDTSRNASLNRGDNLLSAICVFTVFLEVEVFGGTGFTGDDIRVMIQDVIKAVGSNCTWDNLAVDTHFVSDEFIIDTASNVIKSGLIQFKVSYGADEFSE